MAFNTYLFACFFAIVLAIHVSPLPWTAKKVALLALSYAFYAAWDPPFVILLWASTLVDYLVARALVRARTHKRALLIASLAFNLGLLAYFKYGAFFDRSIVTPIGISFYTFMTISYVVDVYQERAAPADSLLDYALFVTFFPHLVSGPIVRAPELLPQFARPRRADAAMFGWGAALVALGLFEKVVMADGWFAPVVDQAYALDHIGTVDAWSGTLAFSGQIFCDFAGYSTCAIGVALMLGFSLPTNFRFPYAAVGFSDFWRRWHISLSTWLRDYLYIPLGGNRRGPTRTQINLALTMLLGGLWHGAAWTFVAWGGIHGAYLVGERALRKTGLRVHPLAGGALTFALVSIAWVFFRADSFARAFRITGAMLGFGRGPIHAAWLWALAPLAALVAMHAVLRDTTLEAAVETFSWPARAAALAALVLSLLLFPGLDRAFIYFQF